MTIDEAAKIAGVSKRTIYRKIEKKKGYGKYFTRDEDGKFVIDGRKLRKYTTKKAEHGEA